MVLIAAMVLYQINVFYNANLNLKRSRLERQENYLCQKKSSFRKRQKMSQNVRKCHLSILYLFRSEPPRPPINYIYNLHLQHLIAICHLETSKHVLII